VAYNRHKVYPAPDVPPRHSRAPGPLILSGTIKALIDINGPILSISVSAGVLASFISPYRATRDWVRCEVTNFIEVFLDCSLEECIRRDAKGLYAKALAGEIPEFTGVSDPYEPPSDPEITVNSAEESIEESFSKILAYLEEMGYVPLPEAVS